MSQGDGNYCKRGYFCATFQFNSVQFNSIHLFSIIKNSKTHQKYAYVHSKMEEVQLKAKA